MWAMAVGRRYCGSVDLRAGRKNAAKCYNGRIYRYEKKKTNHAIYQVLLCSGSYALLPLVRYVDLSTLRRSAWDQM